MTMLPCTASLPQPIFEGVAVLYPHTQGGVTTVEMIPYPDPLTCTGTSIIRAAK